MEIKINKKYPWAVNLIKLDRAIQECHSDVEADIKAKYIELAGLVRVSETKKREPAVVEKIDAPLNDDEEIIDDDEVDAFLDDKEDDEE